MPEFTEPTSASNDHELAAALAGGAGRILLDMRAASSLSDRALGNAGDAVAHEWIAAELAAHRPADGLLSEEGANDQSRLAHSRVWIVDPLDGTREFSERRADWAVHICLAVDGAPSASAVAMPDTGEVFASLPAPELPVAPPGLRIAVSRTRPPQIAVEVARRLGAELVPMGSAGAKTMAVVRGDVHGYLHAGGQYEWDSAAPVGVAAAAGLHVSRVDGSVIVYNKPDPWSPDLLVCRPELAEGLLAAIKAASV